MPTTEQLSRPEYAVDPETGCWVWVRCRDKDGYGQVNRGGFRRAHRWYYAHHVGPIPDGLHLDHLCKNRACVNPAHLEPVTARENWLRSGAVPLGGQRSGDHLRGLALQRAMQTHCKRGHPFDEGNTYHWDGHRICRTCHLARRRRQRAAAKAAA